MKILIVCKGNPEYHEILMPFREFEDAENYAEQQAYGSIWKRLNDFEDMCLNDGAPNIAMWYDEGALSYISIEEWELN